MVTEQIMVWDDCFTFDRAAKFVELTSKFKSSIYLEKENKRINAKSFIGVIAMKLGGGDKVSLLVDGSDENIAIEIIKNFIAVKKAEKICE